MTNAQPQVSEYRCPGENYAISRAVHLGRLARFYPGCRQCVHRDDTGTLSPRQVRLLAETQPRGKRQPLFHEEGAGGVYKNDLGPTAAREMAAAMGLWLQRPRACVPLLRRSSADSVPALLVPSSGTRAAEDGLPVVIAGDGRPLSADLVAAVSEGLRWTGCHVIDISPATAACLAFAIDDLRASGGILVGNPGHQPQYVGLKFWDGTPRPLSAGGSLESLREIYESGTDRPTRSYGSLRRYQADVPYLASLASRYHALRPLRLVLHSASGPLVGYLRKLTAQSACRIIPCRTTRAGLAEQVQTEAAHFAAEVDGDGETCQVFDEQGRPVPPERILLLVARYLLSENPQGAVVLANDIPSGISQAIEAAGGTAILPVQKDSTGETPVPPRRSAMAAAMEQHRAILGGGSDGRFWYSTAGPPLPDALMTLTLLLGILSQSDRPLSEVLR